MKKSTFVNFKAEILDGRPDKLPQEMAGYSDSDMMFIKAVAVYEGLNSNLALMERADLAKARYSFVGKPLKIRFVNDNPTGHGYDPETNTFDEIIKNIGFIYDAEGQLVKPDGEIEYVWGQDIDPDAEGKYQIVVYMVMWQKYYPEIALRLRQLHASGDLKFSIEAERDYEITPEGYRRCFNILFNGLCVVENPAFKDAKSLMVAELLKEKGGKNMDELKKMLEDMKKMMKEMMGDETAEVVSKHLKTLEAKVSELSVKVENAEAEVTKTKEELASVNGTLKTVEAERDALKSEKEIAEKAKLGAERHAKLEKYGEVAKSVEELAEMKAEEFVAVLEEAVANYVPNGSEQASAESGLIGTPQFKPTGMKAEDKKATLLSMVEAVANAK